MTAARPVDDFCCRNNADILTVSCCRKSADQGAQNICDSVHDDTALQFFIFWFPFHTSYCCSRKISDRLNGVDGKQHTDCNAGGWIERKSEMQWLRELEVARGLDSGKIDESQTRCKDIPCDDSYEDGRKL